MVDERSVVIQKNVGAALRTRYSTLEETEGKREAFEVMEDGEMRKGRAAGLVRSSSVPRGPWQKSVYGFTPFHRRLPRCGVLVRRLAISRPAHASGPFCLPPIRF